MTEVELRERLREELSWMDVGYEGTPIFDQLMTDLDAMGVVFSDRGRVERLRTPACKYQALDCGMIGLLPGDLDPLPGVADGE